MLSGEVALLASGTGVTPWNGHESTPSRVNREHRDRAFGALACPN